MTEMTKMFAEMTTAELVAGPQFTIAMDLPAMTAWRKELQSRLERSEAALEAANAELARLRRPPRAYLVSQNGTRSELAPAVNWAGPQGIMINGRMFPAQDSEIAKYVDDPIEGGTA